MILSPLTESYCFLTLVLVGMLSAAVYFFTDKATAGQGRIIKGLGDAVAVSATLVILFFSLQKACGGNVRIYQIAGFILGFLLFKHFLSLICDKIKRLTQSLRKRHRQE